MNLETAIQDKVMEDLRLNLAYRCTRHSIVLLEVLIAFALVALCALPLIYPHVFILRSEKKFISTVELDHLVNLLFADILQKLYQNEIPWQDIESGKKIAIESSWLKSLDYKQELLFTGDYHFIKLRQKPSTPGDKNAYIFSLEFVFIPKSGLFLEKNTEKSNIVYHYELPIERNLK